MFKLVACDGAGGYQTEVGAEAVEAGEQVVPTVPGGEGHDAAERGEG